MGIIRMWNNDIVSYRFMVRHGSFECNVLTHLEYFDRLSNIWIVVVE
jgi:hypothetical protein